MIPEPHLPSPLEVTFQRKRRREVEGAKEGVKQRKKDEDQHQSTRGKAVGAFMAAAEGVRICKLVVHVVAQIKFEVNHLYI